MKANELMIGDWVYIFDPDDKEYKQAYQVSEIREEGIRTHMFCDTYEEEWFDPIPLTEEMLKANGWKTYCEFGANFLATRLDWNLTIVSKKIGNTYLRIAGNWICDVNYVHELQRILRGCGLMDLADNFKLE